MRKASGTSIDIYERYADQYDAGRFECVCGKLQNETEIRIVTRLINQRGRILDAGAGTGRMATAMVGVAINVVGVDTSQRMLTLAKERADRMGLASRVSLVRADVRSLPFKASSFSAVVSIRVLSHYQDLDPIIDELGRVLKLGGEIVLDASSPFAAIYRRLIPSIHIPSAADSFHTVRDLRHAMGTNGTEISTVESYSILPPSMMHRTICVHFREKAVGLLRRAIQTRHGLLTILRGVKRA